MTNEEAIRIISAAQGECEWNAPLDYQIAFDMAIRALRKQMPRKCVKKDGHFVCSITRNYFKIYTDSEPSEIVEKISNLCGSREKLIEIWNCLAEEIADYDEGDEVCDCISRNEAITACQIGWRMDDWTRNHIAENIKRLPSVCKFLKTESEETTK